MKIATLLSVLLLTVLLAASATAQINWLKQDGNTQYLAWDNGTKSKSIFNGDSATLATGYFGSTASQTVQLTVTVNSKETGQIVSTVVSKNVNVANTLGYEVVTIIPQHYDNKAGQYIVVVKLKDANNEVVDSSLVFTVNHHFYIPPGGINTNHEPSMDVISDKEVFENQQLTFNVHATDADNEQLQYQAQMCTVFYNFCLNWNQLSYGASLEASTGKFTWKPSYDFLEHPTVGKNVKVRFRAYDANEYSDWKYMNILVKDVNRKPYFNPSLIDVVHVHEGQLYTLTVHGFDPDQDAMDLQIFNKPADADFVNNGDGTATFSWRPTFQQSGNYMLRFTVTDTSNEYSEEYVSIIVTEMNQLPQLDHIGNKVVTEGDELFFSVHATDLDNDQLFYSVEDLPEGAKFVNQGFKWIPDFDQAGNYQVSFKVTDSKGGMDQETIVITVVDYNEHPTDNPQCNDGVDNDGDGKIDFPADLGCQDKDDDDESDDEPTLPECKDGIDNDGDGKEDSKDSGCHTDGNPNNPGSYDQDDDDESDENDQPECSDGIDNDGDGDIDMQDKDCDSPTDDEDEDKPQCKDGKDNDHDGKIDYPQDPGCADSNDNSEINAEPEDSPNTNIKIKSAHIVEEFVQAGDAVIISTHIFNNGETDLKDVKVQASLYEIGAVGSTSDFTLKHDKGSFDTIYVPLPADVPTGLYIVKITAKNSHYHTSTYRLVYIQSNTFK